MTFDELADLANPELEKKLDDTYRELFNLRFQRAQNQLKDTNGIKRVRHDIARIKTVLRQRELAQTMNATQAQGRGEA